MPGPSDFFCCANVGYVCETEIAEGALADALTLLQKMAVDAVDLMRRVVISHLDWVKRVPCAKPGELSFSHMWPKTCEFVVLILCAALTGCTPEYLSSR